MPKKTNETSLSAEQVMEKPYRNLDLLSKCIKQDMTDYLRGDFSFLILLKYVWIDLLELRSAKKYDARLTAQLESLKEKV